RSLLSLRSPLIVEGTFKQPRFHPDYGRVGLRAAIALALGNIAPPAALLATLGLGPGADPNCGGPHARSCRSAAYAATGGPAQPRPRHGRPPESAAGAP